MVKLASALRNPFSFLFARSSQEERVAAYVIREHERGRSLEDILSDPYVRNRLTPAQQSRLLDRPDIIRAVGTELEAFGKKGAQDDDVEVAKVYEKAGAKVSVLDAATVGKWRDIARDTAWKDYGAKTAASANLLKLASDVSA